MALEQARALRSQLQASLRDAVRTDVTPVITGGTGNAYSTLQSLNQQIELLEKNYKAGGEAAAGALKQADFEKKIAGLSNYERALEAIRRKFEVLRDAASKSGDAATREQRIATYNAQETAEVATLGTQTRIRARGQIEIPADYLPMIRAAESSGDDGAISPTGAVGRYQFTKGTWLEIFKKEKDALYADIQSKYADPTGQDRRAVERDVLALRTDPGLQEDLARALTYKNAGELAGRGIEINSRNLYGAHNIGVGGITALVRAQRDNRGGVTAQSVLDPIDTDLVRGNRAYYGNGKTVDEALATLQRKTLSNSAEARASRDRVQAVKADTDALNMNAAEQERVAAINEQLRAARERGEEVGLRFKNAEELQAAVAKGLTGDLKLQTDALLANASARERAVRTNLSARFEKDMQAAYSGLGRTPDEQAAYQQARFYGVPGTAEFDQTYNRLRDLQTLVETKSTAGGFLKDMARDLQRGTSFATSLSGALNNLTSRLTDRALDSVTAGFFGSAGGKGGAGGGDWISTAIASAKSFMGFDRGGYTGDGGKYDVAGYVHRGEVVFSQADVARHGGPDVVDAMRRGGGMRGYAEGGIGGRDPLPARDAFSRSRSSGDGSSGGNSVVKLEVINENGSSIRTREVPDGRGGRKQQMVVGDAWVTGIGTPQAQQAMAAGYGLKPRLNERG